MNKSLKDKSGFACINSNHEGNDIKKNPIFCFNKKRHKTCNLNVLGNIYLNYLKRNISKVHIILKIVSPFRLKEIINR